MIKSLKCVNCNPPPPISPHSHAFPLFPHSAISTLAFLKLSEQSCNRRDLHTNKWVVSIRQHKVMQVSSHSLTYCSQFYDKPNLGKAISTLFPSFFHSTSFFHLLCLSSFPLGCNFLQLWHDNKKVKKFKKQKRTVKFALTEIQHNWCDHFPPREINWRLMNFSVCQHPGVSAGLKRLRN